MRQNLYPKLRPLAASLLATCALPAQEPGTVVQGELGRSLDRAVQRATGGGFWGAVLVARGGEALLAKGYGFADYEARPNGPNTLFEIASASKQFTAAAVLRLHMEGKLEVTDPLDKFFKAVPRDKRGITIHQLLTHTSGLSPETGVPYDSPFTREQLVAYMLAQPLASKPGEKFAYCNFGYALLAALVEVVSGRSFEEFSRENLFRPAGLKETGFVRDPALDAKRAAARLIEGRPGATATEWHWGWGYRGMGGVVSSALDLLRWDRALRGEAVLDAKTKALLYTPEKEGYACGWLVALTPRGTTRVQHSGSVAGFAVQLARHLEEDAVVVLLSNGRSDLGAALAVIDGLLFPKPRIRALLDPAPYALDKNRAVEFAGLMAWRVAVEGEEVVLALEHRATRHAAAIVRMPAGRAGALAAELGRLLPGKDRRNQRPMDAGLYLGPYAREAGPLELLEELELLLMPRYSGVDQSGREIEDERVTLVLQEGGRNWPLMAKMDDRTARGLQAALAKAARRE